MSQPDPPAQDPPGPDAKKTAVGRRTILSNLSSALMAFGLVSSYGTFAALMGRFLYPKRESNSGWMFVTNLAAFPVGSSISFQAPAGQRIAITRFGAGEEPSDFIALSDVCPHLGCRVHWEAANRRFFCPCHNGAFDASGAPIAGPPKDAGRGLSRYSLKVERGLLLIAAPTELIPGTT